MPLIRSKWFYSELRVKACIHEESCAWKQGYVLQLMKKPLHVYQFVPLIVVKHHLKHCPLFTNSNYTLHIHLFK